MGCIEMLNGREPGTENIDTSDAGEFMSEIYESCGRAVAEKPVGKQVVVALYTGATAM